MPLKLNAFLATTALVISTGALAQAQPAKPATPPAAQKAVPAQPTTTTTTTTTATDPLAATPQSTAPGQTQSTPGQTQTTPGQASELTPATTGQTPSGNTVPNAADKPVLTAATSADLKAGVSVYDQKGDLVGKVESVSGDNAVVSTGSARASIALSSFGKSDQGLVISMTKGELNAAAKKSKTK